MLAGTLCGVEMGLRLAGVPHTERRRAGGARRPGSLRGSRARVRRACPADSAGAVVSPPCRCPSSSHAKPVDTFARSRRARTRAQRSVSRRGAVRPRQPRAVRDRRLELSADSHRSRHSARRRTTSSPRSQLCRKFGAPLLPRGRGDEPRRPMLQRRRGPRFHEVHEPDPRAGRRRHRSRGFSPASCSTRFEPAPSCTS